MNRSLVLKLTLAFLLVSLVGVALVAIFSRVITVREFDRLVSAQAKNSFTGEVLDHYQTHGSWQGIETVFQSRTNRRPDPPSPPDGGGRKRSNDKGSREGRETPPTPPTPIPQFGLADQTGQVLLRIEPYRSGQHLSAEQLAQGGTPLEIEGQQVGTILETGQPRPPNALEEQYLARTNIALLIAAGGVAIIALVLGLALARTLTRPLRELTGATRLVAQGDLAQEVPIRSKDELGQLAVAFNRMSADLAQANHLRRQMTADIAHDLGTPLTVITGYIEAMRDGDLEPTQVRFEAMHDEAQHLKRLVLDLRTLSLADAGELSLNRESVPVQDLLERVAAAYRHQARQQNIKLDVLSAANLPHIEADPERMVQVLGNLVSNALRYTPEGGQIRLAARSEAANLWLTVQDNGSGIPPAELPHIFNRFYRVHKSRPQSNGQSGLGLAIARALVEAHGGTISVKSELGQGTIFIIKLNLRQNEKLDAV